MAWLGALTNFELARDVVQEAFISAYRDLSKLKKPERFGRWIHGFVRHCRFARGEPLIVFAGCRRSSGKPYGGNYLRVGAPSILIELLRAVTLGPPVNEPPRCTLRS